MSRTDLDSSTLARSLRRLAGDGSIEWVMEPIQASVLLDIADLLDENAKLRELLQASLRDFRRMYDYDEQDGWRMVDAIDRMVIGMRKLGFDAGLTEQELRIKVN